MDIVQKFGEDVAVPKNPEREGSPRLITIGQIAEEHGVSRSSVHNYRRSATFPRPVQVEGSTKTQYRADEVAAWFEANPPQQGKRTDLAPPEQGEPMPQTTDRLASDATTKPDYLTEEQWGALVARTMHGMAEGLQQAGLPVEWVGELITPTVAGMLPRLDELTSQRQL